MDLSFTNDEKINIFDELYSLFFKQNFGRLSKSDMEAFMFHFYFEKMIENSKNEEDIINYNKCSDYIISKELGITQQKVKNLKIMNQLLYPNNRDWKKDFAQLTLHANYDETTHRISLNIPDPNLYLEIQNYIEEQGGYIEKQLNGKLLQIKAEYYLQLIAILEPEENRKNIIKKLKKLFKENNIDENVFDEKNIGKSILQSSLKIIDIVSEISEFFSPSNILWKAFIALINFFFR